LTGQALDLSLALN